MSQELPTDLVSEAAVLYAVIYIPKAAIEVLKSLTPKDMFTKAHKAILGTALAIHGDGHPVDLVTISARLQAKGNLEKAGGMDYLDGLRDYSEVIPNGDNIKYYIHAVKDKALTRELITSCQSLVAQAYGDSSFSPLFMEFTKQGALLSEASKGYAREVFVDAQSLAKLSLRQHADRLRNGLQLSYGLRALDEKTGGGRRGDLTILAGRPAMGKTACATSMAISLSNVGHVPFFSLEMPGTQIADRALCNLSGLSMGQICDVRTDERALKVQETIFRISPRIHINDWCRNPVEIIAHVRELKSKLDKMGESISAVFIDHLGKVHHPQAGNDYLAVGKTTGMLKEAAKDLDVHFIVLNQINRSSQNRDSKIPVMSDLAESGKIEQDADNIFLLYRDEYYNHNSKHPGMAEIIIAKQRNGENCSVGVEFHKQSTTFRDLDYDPFENGTRPY